MSTDKELPVSSTKTPAPKDQEIVTAASEPVSPLSHDQKVDLIIATLRELQGGIPNYAVAPPGRRRKVAAAAAIPDAALDAVAEGCSTSPRLAVAADLTAEKVRDTLQHSLAYRRLVRELLTFARGVDDTITEKRFGTGRECVRALKLARNLGLKEDASTLVPHLTQIEEAFKRPRRTREERELARALKQVRENARKGLNRAAPLLEPPAAEFKAGRDLET